MLELPLKLQEACIAVQVAVVLAVAILLFKTGDVFGLFFRLTFIYLEFFWLKCTLTSWSWRKTSWGIYFDVKWDFAYYNSARNTTSGVAMHFGFVWFSNQSHGNSVKYCNNSSSHSGHCYRNHSKGFFIFFCNFSVFKLWLEILYLLDVTTDSIERKLQPFKGNKNVQSTIRLLFQKNWLQLRPAFNTASKTVTATTITVESVHVQVRTI